MRLFRAFGIQVSVDWSWLIALGYVMFVMVDDYQRLLGPGKENLAFAYGVAVAFAFFGSIVLHEFGHAIVARRNRIGILGIDLWMLGGLAKMDREPQSAGVEFRVSAAGPFVTLILAAGLLGGAALFHGGPAEELRPLSIVAGESPLIVALTTLGWINFFLLFFNLIPAYPLDGGRIARAIIWAATGDSRRATLVSAAIGKWFGFALVGLGALMLAGPGLLIGGILFMFMGWTLAQSARAAAFQVGVLGDARILTVADVMDREPVAMPGDASAQRALDEFFWRYRWPWFPVVDSDGRFLGLIEQDAVDGLGEGDLQGRVASELISADSASVNTVRDDTPLTAVLADPRLRASGSLMVVDEDGHLLGVVTLPQVQRALREAIARAGEEMPPTRPS